MCARGGGGTVRGQFQRGGVVGEIAGVDGASRQLPTTRYFMTESLQMETDLHLSSK